MLNFDRRINAEINFDQSIAISVGGESKENSCLHIFFLRGCCFVLSVASTISVSFVNVVRVLSVAIERVDTNLPFEIFGAK